MTANEIFMLCIYHLRADLLALLQSEYIIKYSYTKYKVKLNSQFAITQAYLALLLELRFKHSFR